MFFDMTAPVSATIELMALVVCWYSASQRGSIRKDSAR
jgi:hypothetical protein